MNISTQNTVNKTVSIRSNPPSRVTKALPPQKAFQQFINERYDAYMTYNQQGVLSGQLEEKTIAITQEQLQELLEQGQLDIQTDGTSYWIVVDGMLYTFQVMSKEELEKRETPSEVLLDMVQECLDRAQERLDKKFYEWTMKKDILYPNVGKRAIITLEDVIESRLEDELEK